MHKFIYEVHVYFEGGRACLSKHIERCKTNFPVKSGSLCRPHSTIMKSVQICPVCLSSQPGMLHPITSFFSYTDLQQTSHSLIYFIKIQLKTSSYYDQESWLLCHKNFILWKYPHLFLKIKAMMETNLSNCKI